MTVTEVKGFGRQKATRRSTGAVNYTVELPAQGEDRDRRGRRNRRQGDHGRHRRRPNGTDLYGKIFVLPLEDVIRIRTDEHGDSAV